MSWIIIKSPHVNCLPDHKTKRYQLCRSPYFFLTAIATLRVNIILSSNSRISIGCLDLCINEILQCLLLFFTTCFTLFLQFRHFCNADILLYVVIVLHSCCCMVFHHMKILPLIYSSLLPTFGLFLLLELLLEVYACPWVTLCTFIWIFTHQWNYSIIGYVSIQLW